MGEVIDFEAYRRRRGRPRDAALEPASTVRCAHCAERHPIVRMRGGEQRCVTAFFDGEHWFCRNRGCRRAWMESNG